MYFQLVSSRFMLEITLDESFALRDAFFSLSDIDSPTTAYTPKPFSDDRPAMLATLFNGDPIRHIEID